MSSRLESRVLMIIVLTVILYLDDTTGVTGDCSRCKYCCLPQVPDNPWLEGNSWSLSNDTMQDNRTMESNRTYIDAILNSAPCPPVWNLNLTLRYFTRTNMTCNQSVPILDRCITSYRDVITCDKKVELLKSSLIESRCETLHVMLTSTCAVCPRSCMDTPTTNHSYDAFFDDTTEASTADDYEPSGDSTLDVMTDLTSMASSPPFINCDIVCLSIVLPLLFLLIVGVVAAIVCVCRQEKQKKKVTNQQIPTYDNSVIPLRKVRPYSLQEESTCPPVTTINIPRPASTDWVGHHSHTNGTNGHNGHNGHKPLFQ